MQAGGWEQQARGELKEASTMKRAYSWPHGGHLYWEAWMVARRLNMVLATRTASSRTHCPVHCDQDCQHVNVPPPLPIFLLYESIARAQCSQLNLEICTVSTLGGKLQQLQSRLTEKNLRPPPTGSEDKCRFSGRKKEIPHGLIYENCEVPNKRDPALF